MKIEVKNKKLVPRYSAYLIEGIKIKPSNKKIQERLKSVGIRPINNVVDITNYIMLDLGQPLHAFDVDKIKGDMIIRNAKKGENITTLDGKKHRLNNKEIVIENNNKLIDLAGIMGGANSAISSNTTGILLQAAIFDPAAIRKASKDLNQITDASHIYERGLDPLLTIEALDKAVKLLGQGKIVKNIDIKNKRYSPKKIKYKSNNKEKKILISLGFKIKGEIIEVPSWRNDVSIIEDLEEEIYRIDGYYKIKPEMPELSLRVPESNSWARIAKQSLASSGYTEVYNYSFTNKGELKIKNKSAYLRTNLLDGIKENLKNNLKNFKEVRIFELGKVYHKKGESWILAGAGTDFLETKGVLEKLLEDMGIALENFDNTWVKDNLFELDFGKLSELASGEREYQPIPKYPAVKRDISILVNYDIAIEEVLRVIQNAGGNLVFDVDLFDVYEMDDQRSLAFHIIYQSMDKTLTDKEVSKLHKKIEKAIEREINGTIR